MLQNIFKLALKKVNIKGSTKYSYFVETLHHLAAKLFCKQDFLVL